MFVSDRVVDRFSDFEAGHCEDPDGCSQLKSDSLLPSVINRPPKLIQLINGSHFIISGTVVAHDDLKYEQAANILRTDLASPAAGYFAPPQESLELVRAFCKISSPAERRRVIELAQNILSGQK